MELVKCDKKHWRRILEIRNLVRKSFINSSIISYETHIKFMETYYKNYIVAIRYGEVVGFAGVVNNDVRVAVDPKYQKRGIGKKLLNKIVMKKMLKDLGYGTRAIKDAKTEADRIKLIQEVNKDN